MKVTVDDKVQEIEEIKFPCLMQTESGTVFMVLEPWKGVCLLPSSISIDRLGAYYDDLYECNLTPFVGTVTLQND